LTYMSKLLDALRLAVETSGKTRYRLAKESGVSAGQLSRLVNRQRGMTIDTIERLAEYLGLRIKVERKVRKGR
jgi:plasmid maintenance system antidote protein VapI